MILNRLQIIIKISFKLRHTQSFNQMAHLKWAYSGGLKMMIWYLEETIKIGFTGEVPEIYRISKGLF